MIVRNWIHRSYSRALTGEEIERARSTPDDRFLSELGALSWFFSSRLKEQEFVEAAEYLQRGSVKLSRFVSAEVGLPFDERDIDQGHLSWQLFLARLGIPQILLRAYELTRRDEHLFLARDVIVGWADYEDAARVARGFLRNDHAIAARTQVIGNFWRHYRNHPGYDSTIARKILMFVLRGGRLLAKRSLFLYYSNHGVIQNLGLLHLSLAFPTLVAAQGYYALAVQRLSEQMQYYLNTEGIVLEHSTLYQKFGIELLHRAFRYIELAGALVPSEWRAKYDHARVFYVRVRRPDGSLPVFGDSWSQGESPNPWFTGIDADEYSLALSDIHLSAPSTAFSIFPIAGYAIWWNGLESWPKLEGLSQTMAAWSHFPGRPHEHADEMSVSLWGSGQTWWTNIGNWPKDLAGRAEVTSWRGSNAPHFVGEKRDSRRSTELKSYFQEGDLRVIELERRGPNSYVARRQVINLQSNLWIVIDSTCGREAARTETIWTTAHNVRLNKRRDEHSYELTADNCAARLTASFVGSPGLHIQEYKGSHSPFAGWWTDRFVQLPASALLVEQPAVGSWVASVWRLEHDTRALPEIASQPDMLSWKNAEEWILVIRRGSEEVLVRRDGMFVTLDVTGYATKSVQLHVPPGPAEEVTELKNKLRATGARYPALRWLKIARKLRSRLRL